MSEECLCGFHWWLVVLLLLVQPVCWLLALMYSGFRTRRRR